MRNCVAAHTPKYVRISQDIPGAVAHYTYAALARTVFTNAKHFHLPLPTTGFLPVPGVQVGVCGRIDLCLCLALNFT